MEKNSPLMTWKRMWLVIIFGCSLWIVFTALSALTPVIISFIFAYATQPVVEFLYQRKIPRGFGILIVLFVFVVLLVLLFIGLIPQVRTQIESFSNNIPQYMKILELWILKLLIKLKISSQAELQKILSDNLNLFVTIPMKTLQASSNFLLTTTKGILSLAMGIVYIGLIPVIVFYIGRDMKGISLVCLQYIHPDYREEVEKRFFRLDELLSAFIKGQLIVGIILSILYMLGFYFMDVPLWLLLGILTGLASMFPYVEWIIAFPIVVLLTILQHQDWTHFFGVLLIFGFLSSLTGMFLVPKILGERIGLHPIVILTSILIGGELLGFIGILLAVPIAATTKVGLEAIYDYYITSDENSS
ncbi:MAG: AI-2E family transporter [Nitrospinota bacterium]|nr:AI-2E family transporter [Nitrospinota bacterium]